jgi:hypothetical protein
VVPWLANKWRRALPELEEHVFQARRRNADPNRKSRGRCGSCHRPLVIYFPAFLVPFRAAVLVAALFGAMGFFAELVAKCCCTLAAS